MNIRNSWIEDMIWKERLYGRKIAVRKILKTMYEHIYFGTMYSMFIWELCIAKVWLVDGYVWFFSTWKFLLSKKFSFCTPEKCKDIKRYYILRYKIGWLYIERMLSYFIPEEIYLFNLYITAWVVQDHLVTQWFCLVKQGLVLILIKLYVWTGNCSLVISLERILYNEM